MDGVLDATETAWLDEHLAGCPDCRRTADEYAAQRFELRKLRDRQPLPPRDLWARTAAAIELDAERRSIARGPSRRRSIAVPSAFIATALAVVVMAGLLSSSQLTPRGDDGSGSVPDVARASTSVGSVAGSATPVGTPIIVAQRTVDFVARGPQGQLQVKSTTVHEVCPSDATKPCDSGEPVEARPVTIDQHAQAVFGDGDEGKRLIVVSSPSTDDPGTVAVISLDAAAPNGSPSPSPSPSVPSTASPILSSASPSTAPTASPPPTSPPTPSAPPTESPTPLVSASPTGSIDVTPPAGGTREIAHGVALVGQTAAYSDSRSWFAFTARPIDGSAGPDIYVWRVGENAARKVTDDGHSVFGSWVGDTVVASRAVDGAGKGTAGLKAEAFLLNASTAAQTALPQTGSAWRPVVDPSGRRAVYWAGTLRGVAGPGFAPEGGRLVLGDWGIEAPSASASPATTASAEPTPLATDQASARHEATIGAGQIDDWDARWGESGTHLAVWIADHENPAIGRLSLYAVSSFDGSIDVQDPLLASRRAAAGFSMSNDGLVWAEPSADPDVTEGSIHLLAWTDQGVGTVSTVSGPAIVIR
jgi:hypothetical protein